MKRLLLSLALAGTVLAPSFSSYAGGLIVCHDIIVIPPHPRPPIVIPPRPVPWPRPRPHVFAPMELQSQQVTVKIADRVARTTVEQVFYNPNSRRREGTFMFPVPKGAAIADFRMEINGKLQKAELLDAKKARQIYTDIVRKMKDPALLEFSSQRLFKVSIFPFEPHGKKRIKLTYNQVLKHDAGLVEYAYPLGTGKYSSKPIKNLSIKVELEAGAPLKAIYSPTHEVEIKRDGKQRATIGLEAKGVKPGQDFKLYYQPKAKGIAVNLISHREGDGDGYFLLLASPGIDVGEGKVVEKDVAFVIDTSGSMAGNKLEQAKKAFQFCVANLNDGDRFEVIRFSTETEALFDGLKSANGKNRKQATEFIKDLKPIGGTAINQALEDALALQPKGDRPFVVIFLTDGRPTIGITSEDQIVKNVEKAAGRTRVFSFGIGTDVNAHLLDKITEETRASSQYVTPNEDIEVKISSFYTKIKEPVLANPRLKFPDGVRVSKLYPNRLPDLFKGEEIVLVGRYNKDARGDVLLEGTVNGKKTQSEFGVDFPKEADHDFIPRLWATRRVGYLLDEIRLHGEKKELKDEVTQLARKYGIVTPYTAYLIIEDERRRGVPMAARTLRRFEADREVLEQARAQFESFKRDKAGDLAIGSARAAKLLKEATNALASQQRSNAEAAQGLGGYRGNGAGLANGAPAAPGGFIVPGRKGAPGQSSKARQVVQPMQYFGGKNFCQNDKFWVDTDVQKAESAKAKRTRVKFNSDAYFALLAKEPKAAQWLALGQNVQFVLNGTIYEIHE